ncbi:MAG: hypothetical protein Kow0047_01390 [Anaerolineae bacterium]
MITVFNGRQRTLGKQSGIVWAQIDVSFRSYLVQLKGAKLAVFLAIALHADDEGWAWPSYKVLQDETGYNAHTIARALDELCQIKIQGHRLLLRYQPTRPDGTFGNNRYLIFPSPDEVARYETTREANLPSANAPDATGNEIPRAETNPTPQAPETNQDPYAQKPHAENVHTVHAVPYAQKPHAENVHTNNNQYKQEPKGGEPEPVYPLPRFEPEPSSPAHVGPEEKAIWSAVLENLRLTTPAAVYQNHFAESLLASVDDDWLIILPNKYAREWVEYRLAKKVADELYKVTGVEKPLRFAHQVYGRDEH